MQNYQTNAIQRLMQLLLTYLISFSASAACCAEVGFNKPNIIFILADDLGYGDVACYGGTKVKTPHIDALAASGMKFNRYYDACAVCTPTRASLLTGRYPLRFGITSAFPDRDRFLVREAVTLPELLKPAGYVSAHVGKWHLGGLNLKDVRDRTTGDPGPREHGFDHYLCMNEEREPRGRLGSLSQIYHQGAKHLLRDDQPTDLSPKHLTEVEIDESIRHLEQFAASKTPFFLNVWFDAPHKPYEEATEEYVAPYRDTSVGDELLYRSMVAHLDGGVGRIMAALKKLGLAENTIVIFSSDNGPTGPGNPGPFRGGKGTLFEGGLRVPFIAAWPEKIKAGQVNDDFAISTDLLPTLCEVVGIKQPENPKPDGQSLLPLLLGKTSARERGPVFWMLGPYAGFQRERGEKPPYASEIIRLGRWKLMARDAEPLALFDLTADPLEKTNVMVSNPKVVGELTPQLKAWLAEPRARDKSSAAKDAPRSADAPTRMRMIREHLGPVIGPNHPDTKDNRSGFETGHVLKQSGTYHMFVNEMFERPHLDMRISDWTSADATNWKRENTLIKSVPGRSAANPRSEIWVTGMAYNERENCWNLFYVAYRGGNEIAGEKPLSDYEGKIWRAKSQTKGRAGLGGPYEDVGIVLCPDQNSQSWEGQQGTDSFFPYQVGDRWYGIYGSHNHIPRGPWPVGLATAPALHGPWQRLPQGNPLPLVKEFAENPVVIRLADGRWLAVFDSMGNREVGYSISSDGINWPPETRIKVQSGENEWAGSGDHDLRTPLGLIAEPDGTFTMIYTARMSSQRFWAVGKCTLGWDTPQPKPVIPPDAARKSKATDTP